LAGGAFGGCSGGLAPKTWPAPMRRAAVFIVAVALAVSADDAGPSPAAEAAPPAEAALPAVAAVAPPTSSLVSSQALYQAYNELHALSQQFDTPIHSPAVVVVGRQTDGKSALIEALMGFQFNHVGGGTKTRRPIAMQMHYHPDCELPRCYLQTAAGEQQLSLADLQAHIETLTFTPTPTLTPTPKPHPNPNAHPTLALSLNLTLALTPSRRTLSARTNVSRRASPSTRPRLSCASLSPEPQPQPQPGPRPWP